MVETHEHVHEDSGRGMGTGMIVGILVVILILVFLVFYGFNAFGGGNQGGVNVPEQVDVNVNPGTEGGGQ